MLPEEPRRDRAQGTPTLREFVKLRGGRACAQAFDLLRRDLQSEVARRPRVGPEQRSQKINLRSPVADAFQAHQRGARRVVVNRRERVEVERARHYRGGGELAVERLLAAESDASERLVVEREKRLRRER